MDQTGGTCFETAWREIAPLVERSLERRGVPQWQRDDVMQETALRLYRFWDNVDPERSPIPLAMTIANNALRDEHARGSHVEFLEVVPDTAARADVENAGIARLELKRVRDLMSRLSPSHRSVLLAEIGCATAPSGSSDATKMLRLRARKKMRSLLDASASGLVAVAPRAVWRALRPRRTSFAAVAPTAVVAVCGVAALLTIPRMFPAEAETVYRHAAAPTAATRAAESEALRERSSTSDRDVSPKIGRRDPTRRAVGAGPAPRGPYWQIGLGDETTPVEGEAEVNIVPNPSGGEIKLGECTVERPSEDSVEAACEADAGGQHVEIRARVRVTP